MTMSVMVGGYKLEFDTEQQLLDAIRYARAEQRRCDLLLSATTHAMSHGTARDRLRWSLNSAAMGVLINELEPFMI